MKKWIIEHYFIGNSNPFETKKLIVPQTKESAIQNAVSIFKPSSLTTINVVAENALDICPESVI